MKVGDTLYLLQQRFDGNDWDTLGVYEDEGFAQDQMCVCADADDDTEELRICQAQLTVVPDDTEAE